MSSGKRLMSLDALRGFDMLFIMGFSYLVRYVCALFPGGADCYLARINKSLWSSSFVLVVGSYSLAMFALFYYIIDVRGWQKWAFPFVVIGLNSITIYMAQKIIPFMDISQFFFGGCAQMLPQIWGKLLLQTGYVMISWLFLYFLYRKQTFLKI